MYCERCGSQLTEIQRFCPSCGKPVGVALVPVERQGKVQQHLNTLSVLWLVAGALNLLGAFAVMVIGNVVIANVFRIAAPAPPAAVEPFIHAVLTIVGMFVGIKGIFAVGAGWGLLQRASWARTMALVMAFLELIAFPLGTALGIYTLIVLLPQDSGTEYDQMAKAA
jgi:hypothetical protein